ncbi:thioesterase family protein [Halodesulfovibrio sp.]|uniref:acyl-CoA thioesterase n=1 Tax=Halodesulfovibrio sp. TaxID=1912772 RepID=UPI0025BC17F8|nr:thioesterase family protein [Halodesulfovibrio sp.]
MAEFPTPETWLSHRVSYGETDAMSVMYYAEYLHLFERSRSEYIREQGMSYKTVEERGIMLPVREAQCRYKRPARFDDLLHIRVGISKWGRASMTFEYEIYNETKDTILATGLTEHACTNEKGRPVKVPDRLKELFVGNKL